MDDAAQGEAASLYCITRKNYGYFYTFSGGAHQLESVAHMKYIVSYFFNVDFLWQDFGSYYMAMTARVEICHIFVCGMSWP